MRFFEIPSNKLAHVSQKNKIIQQLETKISTLTQAKQLTLITRKLLDLIT